MRYSCLSVFGCCVLLPPPTSHTVPNEAPGKLSRACASPKQLCFQVDLKAFAFKAAQPMNCQVW